MFFFGPEKIMFITEMFDVIFLAFTKQDNVQAPVTRDIKSVSDKRAR